jgi:23S rRNA pseudouridine2605 synthase
MQERLQKILSRAGISSRRAAEQIMAEGRITVNGETVREPGTKADLETDDVRVDGVRVKPPLAHVYIVLNKPKGVVTTRNDPERRQTVMDLVPHIAGLFPVGRLDVTTEGLILLTNDGAFAERVAHPRYETPRVYLAKVRNVPDAATFERMRKGVMVEGDRLSVDRVRLVESDKNSWVELTLHEGKHHEVRRLLEAVGHPVSKLQRVSVGPVTLKGLSVGEYRSLTPHEIQALLKPPSKRPAPRPERPAGERHGSGPRGRAAVPDRGKDRPPVRGRRSGGRGHGTSASRGGQPNRPAPGRDTSEGRDRSADRKPSSGRASSGDRGSSNDRERSAGRDSSTNREWSSDRKPSSGRASSGDRSSSNDRDRSAERGSSAGRGASTNREWSSDRKKPSSGHAASDDRRSSNDRERSAERGSSSGRGSSGGRGRKPPAGRGADKGGRRGRTRG